MIFLSAYYIFERIILNFRHGNFLVLSKLGNIVVNFRSTFEGHPTGSREKQANRTPKVRTALEVRMSPEARPCRRHGHPLLGAGPSSGALEPRFQ